MRTKFVASVIVVALWAVTAPAQNQVPNWEFDQQVNLTTIWNLWQTANFTGITIVEGAGLSGRYAMKVDCAGALDPMQFFRSYLKLEQGKKYYISFMAKAVAPRPISVGLEARALYNWVTYWQTDIQLTTEAQLFNFTYTHTGATVGGTGTFDSDIDLQFWLAGNGTDFYLDRVWMGTEPPPSLDKTRATDPVPVIGATDLAVDPSLSWTPGAYAATHNVYLGTSFADVNTADATKPQLVSQGQTETTYKVSTPLEYGKTYYWRVDEVNAAPSTAVFKGNVWSFTVEPYTYPLTSVTATASSYDKTTTTPANTVNGSGLTGDLHGISLDTMWTSSMTGPTPVWIQYQFDKAYKLSELWVWNHNTEMRAHSRLRVQGCHHRVLSRRDDLDAAERHAIRPGAGDGRVCPQHHRGLRRRHGPVRQADGQEQLEPGGPQAVRPERSALLLHPGAGPDAAARQRRRAASAWRPPWIGGRAAMPLRRRCTSAPTRRP